MRLDVDLQVEVAARPAVVADLALAGQAHLRAVVDAGRDLHGELALALLAADAAAVLARVRDDATLAAAAVARRDVDELAEDALLDAAHLAGAVARAGSAPARCPARRAGRCRRSRAPPSAPRSPSRRRRRPPRTRCVMLRRTSAPRAGPRCVRACAPPKNASKMSPRPPKPKPSKPRAKPSAPPCAAAWPKRSYIGAALGVGEHLVGLVDLLEARLGARLLVAVGVVLHRQAAERLLEVVRRWRRGPRRARRSSPASVRRHRAPGSESSGSAADHGVAAHYRIVASPALGA